MSNPGLAEEADPGPDPAHSVGTQPSTSVRSPDSSVDSLQVEGPVLIVGRKWAEKDEDNWWCPSSATLPRGVVKFKLTDERNRKYDGAYLADSSEDDAVQVENVLPDATHFFINGVRKSPHTNICKLALSTLGKLLQKAENTTLVLESLSITGGLYFDTEDMSKLFECVLISVKAGKLKKLNAFTWESGSLGDAKVETLAALIKEDCLPLLTELSLIGSQFGSAGGTALCSVLHHVGDLRILNLGWNNIGHGHLCLAEAMQSGHLEALETINLQSTAMGDADCEAYAKAMTSGKVGALKEIDFQGDWEMTDAGVTALGTGLQSGKVKNLERLLLRWSSRMEIDGMGALATAMEEGMLTKLVVLYLCCDKVSENGIRRLATALKSGNVNCLEKFVWKVFEHFKVDYGPLVCAFFFNTALICKLEVRLSDSLRRKYELQVETNRRQVHCLEEMGGRVVPATFGKVYLCGNPEVGKTTLRKSLQRSYMASLFTMEKRSHEEPRTRGIEICKMKSEGGRHEKEITLSLWDMAGQEDYHLVHNSFLPGLVHGEGKATMFVVMCTSKDIKNAEEELRSWFKFIASSVDQSTGNRRDVFLVVNQWKGDTTKSENAVVWKSMLLTFSQEFEEYLCIKTDPLIVDARTRKSVQCIKQALFKQSREMLETEMVPEICHFIQTNLSDWGDEKKEFPVISLEDFDREIRRKGAKWSEKALEAAAKYLDEVGELIYLQKEFVEEKLIVLFPDWFCKHIMGNIYLAEDRGVHVEQLFRSKVDSHTGSISIKDFTEFFASLEGAWQSSRAKDVLAILLWRGFCYEGRNENIFIPSLIEKNITVDHLWDSESKFGDRGGQWVMGYQVAYAQNGRTLAPIALWHKFAVELAQSIRFNGRPDNDFVVGKHFTYFKVDYMVVRIEVNADEKHPTFDCVEILVKPFLSNGNGDLDLNTRKQCQIDLASDIVEILLETWKHVCPGIDFVQRVVWPWPVSRQRPKIEEKQNLEVNEMKQRVQESGVVKKMHWHVGDDDTITEVQLLCTKDKEAVLGSLRGSIRDVQAGVREAIRLHILSSKDEVNEAWISSSVENEIGSSNQWTSASMQKMTSEEASETYKTNKGKQQVDKPSSQQFQRDDELHRKVDKLLVYAEETLKGISEVDAKLSRVMDIHKALRQKVEDIGRIFLQDREQTCPKFVYVGKRNSGKWIRLKDVISSTVKVSVHVYFACEANYNSDEPHKVKDQQGIDVSELTDWARKILPLVKVSLTILFITAKVTANLAAPGTGLIFDNFTRWEQTSSIAEGFSLATGLSVQQLDELAASDLHLNTGSTLKDLKELYGRSREAMTQILAKLTPQEFKEKVGLQKGTLYRTDGTLHGVVWICTECFENYRKSNLISELN